MDKVILENVRCFRTRVEAPLAPITLLVGENSTGKSSFLGLVRVAADVASSRSPNFNIEPFRLGSFDSIAHYHGGKGKRATSFTIGQEIKNPDARRKRANEDLFPETFTSVEPDSIRIEGTFESSDGQARLTKWSWTSAQIALEVEFPISGKPTLRITTENISYSSILDFAWSGDPFPIAYIIQRAIFSERSRETENSANKSILRRIDPQLLDRVVRHISTSAFRIGTPYAIAPIRTRPERTYDSIRDQPSPEGQHVPVILSQMSAKKDSSWSELRKTLMEFGDKSGLFSSVDIRHLGRKRMADPFQLEIGLTGQQGRRNIIDVGYGVSQVLPILVESLVQPSGTTFLVQQPEVHLHPRAQAELALLRQNDTERREPSGASRGRFGSEAGGAARKPAFDDGLGDREPDGDEGVGEVTLRPRLGADEVDWAFWS